MPPGRTTSSCVPSGIVKPARCASVAGDCDTASTFDGPRPPCGKSSCVIAFCWSSREEQRALALHRRLQRGRDRAVDDGGLLGGAGRAPVEDLGGHDAARRVVDVAHGGVDVGRHVARADGVGRLAGGVRREHHRARARGEHEVGAVMAHERVGARHRDARHRLDQVGAARPPPARPPASRARSRRSSARRADAAPARSRCASWPRSAT